MALKSGIVGLPNVGKSTLFNALTSAKALAANYPFATKDPNVGMITVPDPRLDKLAEIVQPKSIVPTTVEIVDIAGLIKGASKGEGLGNQFLGNIREVNAIIHVIRCFDDDNVVHVDGSIDPVRDKEIIDTELLLKDLETVEKNLDKFQKAAKSAKKEDLQNLEFTKKLLGYLESGQAARDFVPESTNESLSLKNMYLLTAKPVLYVLNVDENSVVNGNQYTEKFMSSIEGENAEVILICAGIEADLTEFDDLEERQLFLEEMGLNEPGVNRVIRASYHLLELITFFTAGPKEVRAWTVRKHSSAPKAAGAIHTDFEKGFIRAEVIKFDDYVSFGSESAVKEAGKMHVEGKEYIVQDGDVIFFRFNV
jgi:GTP-binding protein YchF